MVTSLTSSTKMMTLLLYLATLIQSVSSSKARTRSRSAQRGGGTPRMVKTSRQAEDITPTRIESPHTLQTW